MKKEHPTYLVTDIPGSQRPNPYSITSLEVLILLYEGAMDYFEEERRRMLEAEGVEDVDESRNYEIRFKRKKDAIWFSTCLKYRQHYFLRAQKLLSMLPEPPNPPKFDDYIV